MSHQCDACMYVSVIFFIFFRWGDGDVGALNSRIHTSIVSGGLLRDSLGKKLLTSHRPG